MIVFWLWVISFVFLWMSYFHLNHMSKQMNLPYREQFARPTLISLLIGTAAIIIVGVLEFF